jgi:hypothetical protein
MKTLRIMTIGLIFMMGLPWLNEVYAQDKSQVIASHLAEALKYEEKAVQQDRVIEDHLQMKQDFMLQTKGEDRVISPQRIEAMNKHCEAIIQSAKKLKNDFLEFARWHRTRAAALNADHT